MNKTKAPDRAFVAYTVERKASFEKYTSSMQDAAQGFTTRLELETLCTGSSASTADADGDDGGLGADDVGDE